MPGDFEPGSANAAPDAQASVPNNVPSCEERMLTSVPIYEGLSLAEAKPLAVERSEVLRTVQEDGQRFVVTMERMPGRVNVVVAAGKIVQACRE
jgi:hypothetical protein